MSPRALPPEEPERSARGGLSPVEIAERVTRLIERRVYRPGDRLKELELVERFASSRSPVREALRMLEAKGLVKIEANRGATVARLTDEELEELFDMRGMMFRLGARRAVERAGPQDRAQIAALADSLVDIAASGDEAGFVRAHEGFVRTLLRVGRCRRIADFICETTPGLPQSLGPIQLLARRPADIAADLKRFAEALGRGEAGEAEAIIAESYAEQARLLSRIYREIG
ncbi:MAG: GntR family transcriptional regulator [Alphaproteobacteria bacterium]|nr:GntR family transcriptional regulator [Alphaproteobacteria bacterium]